MHYRIILVHKNIVFSSVRLSIHIAFFKLDIRGVYRFNIFDFLVALGGRKYEPLNRPAGHWYILVIVAQCESAWC